MPVLVPGRDWSELPPDVLSLVFAKIGAIDVLMGAGLVCHPWLNAAKAADLSLWRTVDMEHHDAVVKKDKSVMRAMAKVAVDRSDGRLEAFAAEGFVNDELLMYVTQRYVHTHTHILVTVLDLYFKIFYSEHISLCMHATEIYLIIIKSSMILIDLALKLLNHSHFSLDTCGFATPSTFRSKFAMLFINSCTNKLDSDYTN